MSKHNNHHDKHAFARNVGSILVASAILNNIDKPDVIALVLGLLSLIMWPIGFLFAIPGFLLASVGMSMGRDKASCESALTLNFFGILIAPFFLLIFILLDGVWSGKYLEDIEYYKTLLGPSTTATTEQAAPTTEESLPTKRFPFTGNGFRNHSVEVSYDDLINNPDYSTYAIPIKVNVVTEEYTESTDPYYATIDGHLICFNQSDDACGGEYPVCESGSNAVVYGYYDGIKSTDEHGEIPFISMGAVDIIEEPIETDTSEQ